MKKVLVTGASGFLGSYITQALMQNGHFVTSVGRSSKNAVECDLSQNEPVLKESVDWVIHAMGKAHMVPATEAEAQVFFDVNLQGTIHLCNAIEKLPVLPQRMVFISTVAVYGLDEGVLISEDAPLLGTSPYAKSKIETEAFLSKWCRLHDVKLVIFRLPLIAGVKPPGNLGAMIQGIQTGRYFNINEGKAKKSVVLAQDVANAIIETKDITGIYNLSDGYHPSFAEIASVIAKQLGKKAPYNIPAWVALPAAFAGNFLGSKAPLNCDRLRKITATLTFDDQLARSTFGWKPRKVTDYFKI
jgi:nucleoside-diphosphate-sugar epimerase